MKKTDDLIREVEIAKKRTRAKTMGALRRREKATRELHDLQGQLASLGDDPYFWTRQ